MIARQQLRKESRENLKRIYNKKRKDKEVCVTFIVFHALCTKLLYKILYKKIIVHDLLVLSLFLE